MVDVLFAFTRLGLEDSGFMFDVSTWLECVAGLLVNEGGNDEQRYVMNHLVRFVPSVTLLSV